MTTLDEKILDYLTGALDPEQVAEVEALIAADPALEAEVTFHRQILNAAENLPTEEPPLEMSAGLMDAAVDAIHSSKKKSRKPDSIWEKLFITFTQPALVGSMAVIMVAVVSVGLYRSMDLESESKDVPGEGTSTEMVEKVEATSPTEVTVASVDDEKEAVEDEIEVGEDEAVALMAEAKEEAPTRRQGRLMKPKVQAAPVDSEPNEGTRRVRSRRSSSRPARASSRKPLASPTPVASASPPRPKPAPAASGTASSLGGHGTGVGGGGTEASGGIARSRASSSYGRAEARRAPTAPPPAAMEATEAPEANGGSGSRADEEDEERLLYASRQLGRFRLLRRARQKAAEDLPDAGNSIVAPWERDLLRLIQNKRSAQAVKIAKAYRTKQPELLKEALFIYLYAEALFGSGQVDQAQSMALSIKGHALYGEVVNMLLEAIDEGQ